MDGTYVKGGSAGIKGSDFQINLLSVFLLNALKKIKDWKLSTENKMAGKFDDVVLELSDGSAILLQAKHKDNKKITLDQLLSTNSRNDDFSLPKYFLSYLADVKTNFHAKFIIICTNAQAGADILRFLSQNSVCRDSMLHHEDSASLFTFNDDIVQDLIANAKVYNKNNLRQKSVDESAITEESVTEFLRHLQIHFNYPSGKRLEKVVEKLVYALNDSNNLLGNMSHRDLYLKIKDWFQQSNGEYLTECRAKAIFCEIKSEKYALLLEDHKVFFRINDFNFTNSMKRIFHVVAERGYLLHLLKVFRSLQHNESKILYAGPDDGLDVQKQIIEAFELPVYTYLIIVSPKFSEELTINELSDKIRAILNVRDYKKVVFVAESRNKLMQQIKLIDDDHDTLYNSLTLEDLSEDTQQMLLKTRSIVFQADDVSLAELFPEHITDDHKKSINSEILEKLVRGETIKVGMKVTDLEEKSSGSYIHRKFRKSLKTVESGNVTISEEDIYNVEEKIVLISNGAGAGKSTVLKNLAVNIKKDHPRLWVVRIELNDCTKIFSNALKSRKSLRIGELLNCRDTTRFTNELEKVIFSSKGNVVLMLDGVDEISLNPVYKSLIMNVLLECQQAENFKKVFVTTRCHMESELTTLLKVTPFTLMPLTEQDQMDFFICHWTQALELEDESKNKCERYARMLLEKVSSWIRNCYGDVKFVSTVLHAKMLAEVFLENNEEEEWQGCEEYLNGNEVEPKLPRKINIAKLYDKFLEKKRDILIEKGNPSGNEMATQALMHQFEQCLNNHRSLALEVILDEQDRVLSSCHQQNTGQEHTKLLPMGIIQEFDNKLHFVHKTFAEYLVAECLLEDLQLPNRDTNFQKLLIDKIFSDMEFDTLRRFLDSYLQKNISPLFFDIFNSYMSLVDDTNNFNLIHQLAVDGNTEIIDYILKCISFKSTDVQASVHKANSMITKSNTLNILRDEVQRIGINIEDTSHLTPLHWAVYGGHLDTVKFLVGKGAEVNSNTVNGTTVLHYAVGRGDTDMVKFLLEKRMDLNVKNNEGHTALDIAVKTNHCDIVRLLKQQIL